METNLVLNFEKYHFMVIEGIVLGHLISSYCKRFIKNFGKITLPLSKLLQKDVDFIFDQPCVEAFQELKKRLTSTPIFQALNWEYQFKLMCDTSNSALGAVLGQRVGKQPHVIAYEFDLEIRDKKGAENAVANHLSQLERGRLHFQKEHLELTKKNLKAILNTSYGMILIFEDSTMTKCIPDPEIQSVLHFYHSISRANHYGLSQTS
ncbi:Retrovirus-related Pol polyprotein from transposon 17.6, partial [Mucuna pruriens]